MKRVILDGVLGEKFGEEWALDVLSPSEAIRAIGVQQKGFFQYLVDSEKDGIEFRVLIDEKDVEIQRLFCPFSTKETFRIVPVIAGQGSGGMKAVIGAILLVVAIVLAAPSGGGSLAAWGAGFSGTVVGVAVGGYVIGVSAATIAMVGAALILSGISLGMTQAPASEDTNPADNKASYLFNGPVNTVAQGGPVPIGYGRLIVGSTLISGGIEVTQLMGSTDILDSQTVFGWSTGNRSKSDQSVQYG